MIRQLFHKTRTLAAERSPLVFQPLPQAVPDRAAGWRPLTLLSTNLWHDWPRYRDQEERLERLAGLIEREQVDIAMLQEVTRRPALRVDEWLSRRLGMAYVYSQANGHESAIGFEEGIAIFSRFPLARPRRRQLDRKARRFVRRLAVGVDVTTSTGPLSVFSVHLGLLPHHNSQQFRNLQAWVTAVAGSQPAIIGGDFNAHEDSPQIEQARGRWLDTFRHLNPRGDAATHELRWPWGRPLRRKRLDYLFLQPGAETWRVLEVRHLHPPDGPHSDHQAVLARLAKPADPAVSSR